MAPRRLGRTGLSVSPIALGTTKLGRNTDVKYPRPFDLPSDEQVQALLDACLAAGINLIDTAPAYGSSEARLGKFLAGRRDRFVLCTKCGESYENGRSTWDFSGAAIERSLDLSLRRLGTDRVDILLLHSNGQDLQILTETDALAALQRAKQAGKARAVGISAKTAAGVVEACRSLDIVMAPFSQSDSALEPALAKAHEAGLGILAIKGLASGALAPEAAIEFVLRQPFIDALVLGTITPQHLRQAVAVAEKL
ncbi:MAG: aldo/keto reductase [Deltaproteobacteria bacterium]|nr:aldo/keto reductase [Deltaproteobacteria bacterium]